MSNHSATIGRWSDRVLSLLLVAGGIGCVFSALQTIQFAGLTSLFADQWVHYDNYLALDFPANVLKPENGHRQVFPGLLFLLDLHFNAGQQTWLLWIGTGMALLSWLVWGWAGLTTVSGHLNKSLAVFWGAVAIFWLVNARVLIHPNESIPAYPIVIALMLGATLLTGRMNASVSWWPVAITLLMALVATFSFRSGIAVWPALLTVAWVAGLRAKKWLALLGGFLLCLALYTNPSTPNSVTGVLDIEPATLHYVLTWLGAPLAHLLFAELGEAAQRLALIAGGVGSVAAGLALLRALIYRPIFSPIENVTLGTMAFVIAVAATVGLARAEYFAANPGQLLAVRYLIWSCLLWAALAVYWGAVFADRRWVLRGVAILSLVVSSLGVSSHQRWSAWAHAVNERNEQQAIAVLMDIQDDQEIWEHHNLDPAVIMSTAQRLREHRLDMFAGALAVIPLDQAIEIHGDVRGRIEWTSDGLDGRHGRPFRRVGGWMFREACLCGPDHVLLVTADNRVVGLASVVGLRSSVAEAQGFSTRERIGFAGLANGSFDTGNLFAVGVWSGWHGRLPQPVRL